MAGCHVALWWMDGRNRWAFTVPFNSMFVWNIKSEVPPEHRMWRKEQKLWLVDLVYGQKVRDLVSVCMPGGICRICWKGGICDVWERIHWAAIGTDAGGLDARRGSRPRPRPEPVAVADPFEAARLLVGVGIGATRAEIRTAARRQALHHHPDRGGDADVMVAILKARDMLIAEIERHGR